MSNFRKFCPVANRVTSCPCCVWDVEAAQNVCSYTPHVVVKVSSSYADMMSMREEPKPSLLQFLLEAELVGLPMPLGIQSYSPTVADQVSWLVRTAVSALSSPR